MSSNPNNLRPSIRRSRAFTMVEMMVTMAVFSLTILGVFYAHIFGLKQDRLISSKLGASDQSRRGFDVLTRDIRSSKIWAIGNGTASTFSPVANGTAQRGNAIRLNLTIETNKFIIYYFNTNACELRRRVSGAGSTTLIASYLTNGMYFQAESYKGAIQTNLTHKGVINCSMEFAQYQYPLTRVGAGYLYDYYKMSFKVTPHVPDGP
jgi:prepilin-type N-terminal cleavage/methylation domain-containing protein